MANEKDPKNIGKSGGSLLGLGGKAIAKAMKGPSSSAQGAARGAGDRIQGRAASHASRSESLVGRIFFSIAGGQLSPTRRATAERIQRGDESDTRLASEAAGVIRSRAERAPSVAATKAAYVEAARNGGREAEQAIILLLRSDSWREVQDSLITRGRNEGKRVSEIGEW